MSGIIKKISSHKKSAAMLLLFLAVTVVLLIFKMYIIALLMLSIVIVNELIVRKMKKQKAPFGTRSRIRNVDCLVIGDISHKEAQSLVGDGTSVSINLPGCSLAGAYEVLRHTFSILKENGGSVVLAVKKKNLNKTSYSPFDVSFFHPVTINRLGLKNVKFMIRFPAVFAPIKSLTRRRCGNVN